MGELSTYVIELVQGATLFREIAVLDSDRVEVDVSAATKSVQIGTGIVEGNFTVVQGSENHLIEIRADGTNTALWPVGSYALRVWLDWGASADIEDEVIFSATIVVRVAL